MKRPILIVIIAVAGAAVLAAGWYLGSPLFINRTVSEAFPVELPSADDMDDMPAAEIEAKRREALANLPQGEAWEDLSGRAQQEIQDRVMDFAAAMPDSDMDDAMPGGASPERLAQGTFMDADRFHKGSGRALIYRLADGACCSASRSSASPTGRTCTCCWPRTRSRSGATSWATTSIWAR